MTDERLRQLLRERAHEVDAVELAGDAWARAHRRRQHRAALVAGAAVAVVVISVAVVVGPGGGGAPAPPVATPTAPAPTAARAAETGAERGGLYAGARVWWAPTADEEARLALLPAAPLPAQVDLAAGAPRVSDIGRALAVYEVDTDDGLDRVVVVGEDGASYSLDVSALVEYVDLDGNRLSPLDGTSLSPDGRHVFFRQPGTLAVYDFAEDRWSTIRITAGDPEFSRWTSDRVLTVLGGFEQTQGGATYDVGGDLLELLEASPISLDPYPQNKLLRVDDEPYGPFAARGRSSAQAQYLAGTLSRDGQRLGGLEGLAVVRDGETSLLAQPAQGGRWKGCCPVAGWLDDETVLLESRHGGARVLAWRTGSAALSRVADIRGWVPGAEVFVGSYADPSGNPEFGPAN